MPVGSAVSAGPRTDITTGADSGALARSVTKLCVFTGRKTQGLARQREHERAFRGLGTAITARRTG